MPRRSKRKNQTKKNKNTAAKPNTISNGNAGNGNFAFNPNKNITDIEKEGNIINTKVSTENKENSYSENGKETSIFNYNELEKTVKSLGNAMLLTPEKKKGNSKNTNKEKNIMSMLNMSMPNISRPNMSRPNMSRPNMSRPNIEPEQDSRHIPNERVLSMIEHTRNLILIIPNNRNELYLNTLINWNKILNYTDINERNLEYNFLHVLLENNINELEKSLEMKTPNTKKQKTGGKGCKRKTMKK